MSATSKPVRLRKNKDLVTLFLCGPLGWLGGREYRRWLSPVMILVITKTVSAQEALRSSLAGDAAAEANLIHFQSRDYTVKYGDFILQVTPSLEFDWNDNVNLSRINRENDFIVKPEVALAANYPVTTQNELNLSVDFGYQKYLTHDEFSRWYLGSGSALSFDVYIKDLLINVHDRFQYTQDSAQEAAVAGTGNYGNFVNTAGLSGTWDLEDVTLNLGYDHQNTESIAGQFNYLNNSSEMFVGRADFLVHPTIDAGLEGSAAFTTYREKLLNDYQDYSVGIYGDWQPGSYFTVKPRIGYTFFQTSQTSAFIVGANLTTWYADLTLSHQATDFLSYNISVGHEIRPGIQSEAIEDTYLRPNINWSIIKNVALQTSLFYEHGSEVGGQQAGFLESNYDWYGGGLSLSYSPMKKMTVSLNYRLTLRSSNVSSDEYSQNMVGLQLTYKP